MTPLWPRAPDVGLWITFPRGVMVGQAWCMRTPRPWTLPTQPVTRALLLASGVTDAMIRTQLATGRLTQLRAGVFLSSDAWPAGVSGQASELRKTPALSWVRRPVASWVRIMASVTPDARSSARVTGWVGKVHGLGVRMHQAWPTITPRGNVIHSPTSGALGHNGVMSEHRVLYLMRHASADSWGILGDKNRPLSPAGRSEAAFIGGQLADSGIQYVV